MQSASPPAPGLSPSVQGSSFIVFIHALFASLTGLPALLTGAAPVSRVCQVFGLAKRLTVTRPAAQRRAPTHFPPAIGRFGVGPAYTASFVARHSHPQLGTLLIRAVHHHRSFH